MDGPLLGEVTADDKEAVLQINDNVYGGLDYLKDYFDDFIRCPHTKLYKAVYKDEIVGFIAATLVDDGDTVVARTARVKLQFEGKGVFKMLLQHVRKMSCARINIFIVKNDLKAAKSPSFQREYNLVASRSVRQFDFSLNLLKQVVSVSSIQLPVTLTKHMLQEYITSDIHREYLFPHGRIVVDSVPFKTIPSNIGIMWKRDSHSLRLTDVKLVDGQVEGLMSISTRYLGQKETLVCSLDVFGTDYRTIESHVMSHLDCFRCQSVTDASVWVVFDPVFEVSVIEDLFKQTFDIKSMHLTTGVTEYCLYEKPLTGILSSI